LHVWDDTVATADDLTPIPVFLDLLSGPNYPLSQAFYWAGWKVVQPIDLQIDDEFDITNSSVQTAIAHILPKCHLVSTAMDCSTKSRIREIALPGRRAPPPLRSEQHPRGLPTLTSDQALRFEKDNQASDFQLAVQHVMNHHGRGAFRENPRRSLHWKDPNEVWMKNNHDWYDFEYDSCCFNSVRKKSQTIRHNMPELLVLPTLRCAHWRSEDEWRPYTGLDGATIYPSKEEAEYSAALVFTLAVAASHWAAERGFAISRISRLPAIECAGDRRGWVFWDPRTFREFAMAPTALALGLRPESDQFTDMTVRVHVHDVLQSDRTLPDDVIYIGHGHFSHRLSPSKWENPFRVGRNGTQVDTVLQFINHWASSPLAHEVHELSGKRLACDCQSADPCHGDVIAAQYMLNVHRHGRSRKTWSVPWRMVAMAGMRVVRAMPVAFSQNAAMNLIKYQFPSVDFHGVKWPVLEDLLNQPLFVSFRNWVHDQGFAADGPLGPTVLPSLGVAAFRAGMAEQAGAGGKRLALPPVVPFNLEPEQHFRAALKVQLNGCPLDFPSPVDRDLSFASFCMVEYRQQLRNHRLAALEVFQQVAARLQPVTAAIRQQQVAVLRHVNLSVHFAFLALLVGILQWPDTSFCHSLFAGFPAVGHLAPCGIWAAQPVEYVSLEAALAGGSDAAQHLFAELRHRVPTTEDLDVIHAAGNTDEQNSWCTHEFGWDELLAHQRPFRLIKRFVITQASGKKRVIDDAASGGQSLFSRDGNKLQFCSAMQPCAHVQALAAAAEWKYGPNTALPEAVVTCGEDLPDAYRKIPMDPDSSWACIVSYPGRGGTSLRFRRYHSMLFELPLAVTAFNRLPFLLQALLRRCFMLLCSFYYDDATFQDWESTAADSQRLVKSVMEIVGYPFASAKSQGPSRTGDFLGLVHDFSTITVDRQVQVWIRERLQTKIQDFILTAMQSDQLHPGTAAKLYGCVTFLDQAVFGKIARAGLNALKERQYLDHKSQLTPELQRAFQTITAVLTLEPKRVVHLRLSSCARIAGASDAAQEPLKSSGGFLLSTRCLQRLGAVVPITPSVVALWKPCEVYIAQLELLMVLQALLTFPDEFRQSSGVWYIDNIASLMALLKGRSDNDDLDHMAQMIHLMLFHLKCALWFEWIQSKSNRSDGISRTGFDDPFVKHYRFRCHLTTIMEPLWRFPLFAVSRIFSFL